MPEKLTHFLQINFDLDAFTDQSELVISRSLAKLDHKHQIANDFEDLLKNGLFSDVALIVGDGTKIFPAHKAILATRSKVFEAMFKHEAFEESEKNEVNITDVDAEIFEQLLKYIYTSKIPPMETNAVELLIAADKVIFLHFLKL